MNKLVLASAFAAIGCGPTDQEASANPWVSLPAGPFALASGPATGFSVLEEASRPFVVRVNVTDKTFAMPWWRAERPIKAVSETTLLLREESIARGRSNNPEAHFISFDLRSGTLTYSEQWAGAFPVLRQFTSQCEVRT